MEKKNWYDKKQIIDEKALTELSNLLVKCQCGHTMIMPVYQDKTICKYCGKKVLNNTKLYFMHKMRKEIKKNEKSNNC